MIQRISLSIVSSLCRLFFGRVRLLGNPLPDRGCPVLYVGVHKNGSLDEWVASFGMRRPLKFLTPLPSGEDFLEVLNPNHLGLREETPLEEAVRVLENGASLFIFAQEAYPGDNCTGELGQDAARIAWHVSQKRADLLVVPVAFFYDNPGTWGSNAEVLIGNAINPVLEGLDFQRLALSVCQGVRIVEGSSSLSQLSRGMAEELARLASIDEPSCDGQTSYTLALRTALQFPRHSPIVEAWVVFRERCASYDSVRFIYGLPLFPTQTLARHKAALLLSACPFVLNIVLNIVPFGAIFVHSLLRGPREARFQDAASRLRARILVGACSLLLWTPLFWMFCRAYGLPWLALLHLFLSLTGGYWTRRFKTNAVQVFNARRHPELSEMQARLREELLFMILQ